MVRLETEFVYQSEECLRSRISLHDNRLALQPQRAVVPIQLQVLPYHTRQCFLNYHGECDVVHVHQQHYNCGPQHLHLLGLLGVLVGDPGTVTIFSGFKILVLVR